MNNLGNFFLDHENTDSAGYYFNWLLRHREGTTREGLSILYQNMAKLLSRSNKGAEAVLYLDSALALVDTSAQTIRVVELFQVQSQYKSDLGDHEEALHLIDRALVKNKPSKAIDRDIKLLKIKSDILERWGKLDASIAVMRRKEKLSDSLFQVRSAAEIQEVVEGYKQDELAARPTDGIGFARRVILLFALIVLLSTLWFVRRGRRNDALKAESIDEDIIVEPGSELVAERRTEEKFLRFNGGVVLPLNSFLFAVKEERYVVVLGLDGQKERTRMSIKSIIELAPEDLVQVHRSHVIRWTSVRSATFNTLKLENGQIVPFGRSYRQKLKDLDHPIWTLIS
jgi:tetratricopeptide (TPR) repeat protein